MTSQNLASSIFAIKRINWAQKHFACGSADVPTFSHKITSLNTKERSKRNRFCIQKTVYLAKGVKFHPSQPADAETLHGQAFPVSVHALGAGHIWRAASLARQGIGNLPATLEAWQWLNCNTWGGLRPVLGLAQSEGETKAMWWNGGEAEVSCRDIKNAFGTGEKLARHLSWKELPVPAVPKGRLRVLVQAHWLGSRGTRIQEALKPRLNATFAKHGRHARLKSESSTVGFESPKHKAKLSRRKACAFRRGGEDWATRWSTRWSTWWCVRWYARLSAQTCIQGPHARCASLRSFLCFWTVQNNHMQGRTRMVLSPEGGWLQGFSWGMTALHHRLRHYRLLILELQKTMLLAYQIREMLNRIDEERSRNVKRVLLVEYFVQQIFLKLSCTILLKLNWRASMKKKTRDCIRDSAVVIAHMLYFQDCLYVGRTCRTAKAQGHNPHYVNTSALRCHLLLFIVYLFLGCTSSFLMNRLPMCPGLKLVDTLSFSLQFAF